MEHFYLLPISILYDRANLPEGMPPIPRRAAPDRGLDEIIHLAFTHATKLGNFVAILKEGKLAPSKLHFAESESFFAQGFKVGYTSWEAHELGRILHNGTNLSKNECGAIFVGLAWGTGKPCTMAERVSALTSPVARIRKDACITNVAACG